MGGGGRIDLAQAAASTAMFAIFIGMHRITVFEPHRVDDTRLEGSFRVGMVTSPTYNNGGQFFLPLRSPMASAVSFL